MCNVRTPYLPLRMRPRHFARRFSFRPRSAKLRRKTNAPLRPSARVFLIKKR
jgi:hypothetical protein